MLADEAFELRGDSSPDLSDVASALLPLGPYQHTMHQLLRSF
jgi:hypothetical protein